MSRYPPKIVYKYRPWNLDSKEGDRLSEEHRNAEKIFTDRTIYLAKPHQFNDPFDMDILPNYALLSKKEWLVKLEESKQYALANGYDQDHVNKQLERKIRGLIPIWDDKHELEEMSYHYLRDLRNVAGIYSSSAHFSQPLLWSHYADNHFGIAVGFDAKLLSDHLNINHGYVSYSDDCKIPLVTPKSGAHIDDIITIFTQKSTFWRYEKEIRFFKILGEDEDQVKLINPKIIKEVILGFNLDRNMKRQTYKMIVAQGVFNHVKFYSSHKIPGYFLFRRKPLDTNNWY